MVGIVQQFLTNVAHGYMNTLPMTKFFKIVNYCVKIGPPNLNQSQNQKKNWTVIISRIIRHLKRVLPFTLCVPCSATCRWVGFLIHMSGWTRKLLRSCSTLFLINTVLWSDFCHANDLWFAVSSKHILYNAFFLLKSAVSWSWRTTKVIHSYDSVAPSCGYVEHNFVFLYVIVSL